MAAINNSYPLMVNQAFRDYVPQRNAVLPALKTGLPSRPANHKSDIGSPQCSEPVRTAVSFSCLATKLGSNRRLRSARVFPKDFFKAFLRESETLGEENGRDGTPAPAL